ncbi:type II toxin-antitoxin system HicB family antitoxin [Candidatus Synechococcus calcipolaris G9]|uniref:Type II toxin-antitoxin system HicB family antitoxin n=1 Tax=Candidatus Synechococcus calcipolaris G9 TaxID=1497997 RepID=A0ABT6EXH3_9SYNE|nr:type II toxin-antitoxin system HicB family antitoxin [Candidatus Synechococcus calcipolaris]MDG2990507.1 type II toxin-antitoxin system HicB family antitoxin [Candidatus Synechococcus calcipolaris G9]
MLIRVILEWDKDADAYSATCPELNFVSSCGHTKEEAIASLKEAIQLMLEPLPDQFLDTDNPRETLKLTV